MRLYLTAETSIPDLYIDYIEVLLKSGEEVSLNWDYSDIERTTSGFSARYKGVYFDEDYANGRIEELRDMKVTGIGVYYESKCEQDSRKPFAYSILLCSDLLLGQIPAPQWPGAAPCLLCIGEFLHRGLQ